MTNARRDLTPSASLVLERAQQEARRAGRGNITPTDLLIGLLHQQDEPIARILRMFGLDPEQVETVARETGSPMFAPRDTLGLDTQPSPLILFDEQGDIRPANQAARDLLAERGTELLESLNETRVDGAEIILGDRNFIPLTLRLPNRLSIVILKDITRIARISQAKDNFLYVLVHDLKSPVGMIMGYAELLQQTAELSDDGRNFIQRLLAAAQRMNDMLGNMLLSIRPLDAIETIHVPCDLAALVRLDAAELEPVLRQRNIRLRVECPDQCYVVGEESALSRIVWILLQSAVHSSPNDDEVIISLSEDAEGVVMRVVDHGQDLLEDSQTRVFDHSRVPRGRGPWLDLAALGVFVEAYQATASARNLPEGGVEYQVRFPASMLAKLDD